MPNDNRYSLKPVEIPSDDKHFYDRPFFAYGIFKEGQLAHSKIEDCVKNAVPDDVPYEMHIRDGVPVIKKETSECISKGEKIYFLECKKKKAYQKISKTQVGNIYKWDTVKIGEKTFNILVTENLKGTFVNVDDNWEYLDTFDGRKDPFFTKVPIFIRKELKEIDYDDDDTLFKIQMYYMLLWSAIDRYCTLKYDVSNNQGDYLKALSEDEVFLKAFYSINAKGRDPIHSATNASPFYFNRGKPSFIINHYYTIRSNVVHRGKEKENEFGSLIRSLNELLDVFEKIIENTFK